MKKILFFLIILLIPIAVNAAELTDKFYVDANIKENGDMDVEIIIVVKGPFNGYATDIGYKKWQSIDGYAPDSSPFFDATAIQDVVVGAKNYQGEEISFSHFKNLGFTWFEKAPYAYNGDTNVYTSTDTGRINNLKFYYPVDEKRVIFYLSYTIKDVVVLHNDMAEIRWNFLGKDFREDISEVKIRINLPNSDNSDYYRAWAHGNLYGEIEIVDAKTVLAYLDDYRAGEEVDVRITFDKSVVNENLITKKTNRSSFNEILEHERIEAEKANAERERLEKIYNQAVMANIACIVGDIAAIIFIYFKYAKNKPSVFQGKYYREFIEEYPVEVVDYLMKKSVSPNAMSASIMNLIYKKNITAEEISSTDAKKKEYRFTLVNSDNLSEAENYLIEFLFTRVGENNTFTNTGLEKYASASATYSKFGTSYFTWQRKVTKMGEAENFYERSGGAKGLGTLVMFAGWGIYLWCELGRIMTNLKYITLILSIITFIYSCAIRQRRTAKGNEDYNKWKAFKNFLLDFSILPQRELPEIAVWQRYMVYAVALGVAKEVEKAMNVRIQEYDPTYLNSYSPGFNPYMHVSLSRVLNDSVSKARTESINRSISASGSSSSSSGGYGGGFSGGGGGGGGSFGGGRF